MAAAIILITIGSVMAISAVEGIGITDVLKGVMGGKIDPRGGSGATTSTDPNAPPDASPTDPVGAGITSNPLGGLTGTTTIDGKPVANWIAKVVLWARTHGWTGQVTSGVRTAAEQSAACIAVCGNPNGCPGRCAAPGQSNHRGSIWPIGAVDVTNPDQFEQVISGYPGGAPIKRALASDPVHFSATGH